MIPVSHTIVPCACSLTALVAEQEDGRQLAETFRERQLRVHVFERDSVPWYLGLSLYIALLAVAAACIPHVYPEVGTNRRGSTTKVLAERLQNYTDC